MTSPTLLLSLAKSRQVAEQKERERKRDKEKREAEAARRLKEAGDAAARRRDKAAHADAVANFRTLLQVRATQSSPGLCGGTS